MGLSLLAYAIPGLTLFLQPQTSLPEVSWPTHATIAAPRGWLKSGEEMFVLENDRPIVAQIEVAAKWPDGSPKWLHAHASFRYAGGKPLRYVLAKLERPPDKLPESPLKVVDEENGIAIDTGAIKLRVARPFAGITLAENEGVPVISGNGGPNLVDERGIEWHAVHDESAEVVVEQQGPAQVTVKATGWYQTKDRRVEPFCRFVTRISAFAGSQIVKIDHATIFADDMRKHAVSELAFKFATPEATSFSSSSLAGSFDKKLTSAWILQTSADRLLGLTQTGEDNARVREVKNDSGRSAGWFRVDLRKGRMGLLTKDFWRKCPKEVQVSRDGITYYAWPKHGEFAKPDEGATRPENVYRFQCFHTGRLLDGRLPSDYFSALEQQTDSTECKAVYARAANLCGVAIHNEFAVVITSGQKNREGSKTDEYLAKLQELYELSPIARVSPTVMAESGAFGPVAAMDHAYPEVQVAVRDGMLGYAATTARYGDYGWAIYGNAHHEEWMNPKSAGVPRGRPSLHRVWSNNHYQHVSTSWRLCALHGDYRLLQWARACTDNYASIGQVRYDALKGRVDGKGERHAGPEIKYHNPGSFWHCKAFVPWGCRDYGMDNDDADAGLTGHWPDPSGLLLAWLFDANRWAKDGYELWLSNVKFPSDGTRREINTTLVHAITAYEYQPSREIMTAIKGMAKGLMGMPLLEQAPGPLWEPTWLSRYHELAPDDAEFNKFIVASADAAGVAVEGMWTLALSATAYHITKKDEYLKRHAGTLARVSREVFRDSGADKRWDKYGFGPGPDRDGHFMLQWPWFYAAIKDAKLTSLPAPDEPGQYLCSVTAWDNKADVRLKGTKILFLQERPAPALTLQATSMTTGDIEATSLQLLSPGRETLLDIPRLALSGGKGEFALTTRPSSWRAAVEKYQIPSDQSGLYTLLLGSNGIGIFQGLTSHPECQILKNSRLRQTPELVTYRVKLTRGYLVPLVKTKITLTLTAMGAQDGSYISLNGPKSERIAERYIRAGDSINITLNGPRGVAGPWLLDAVSDHSGYFTMSIAADVEEPLAYGRKLEDIQLILSRLRR